MALSVVTIQVSYGDLADRISILEIKSERITEVAKLLNIRTELESLIKTWRTTQIPHQDAALTTALVHLKAVNEQLWDTEDAIRDKERTKNFDADFIELARRVYLTNDRRAGLKREIDILLGSKYSEEKSYQSY